MLNADEGGVPCHVLNVKRTNFLIVKTIHGHQNLFKYRLWSVWQIGIQKESSTQNSLLIGVRSYGLCYRPIVVQNKN